MPIQRSNVGANSNTTQQRKVTVIPQCELQWIEEIEKHLLPQGWTSCAPRNAILQDLIVSRGCSSRFLWS